MMSRVGWIRSVGTQKCKIGYKYKTIQSLTLQIIINAFLNVNLDRYSYIHVLNKVLVLESVKC